jgi:hypothetical protein
MYVRIIEHRAQPAEYSLAVAAIKSEFLGHVLRCATLVAEKNNLQSLAPVFGATISVEL